MPRIAPLNLDLFVWWLENQIETKWWFFIVTYHGRMRKKKQTQTSKHEW